MITPITVPTTGALSRRAAPMLLNTVEKSIMLGAEKNPAPNPPIKLALNTVFLRLFIFDTYMKYNDKLF